MSDYYCHVDEWQKCYFGIAKDHKKHYELLLKVTTEKEIENIIGNSFWTENKCKEGQFLCRLKATVSLAYYL